MTADTPAGRPMTRVEDRRGAEGDVLASLRSVLTPLRELAAKVEPVLPWEVEDTDPEHLTITTPNGAHYVAHVVMTNDGDEDVRRVFTTELIVALANSLPALLKLADESAGTAGASPDAPLPLADTPTRADAERPADALLRELADALALTLDHACPPLPNACYRCVLVRRGRGEK